MENDINIQENPEDERDYEIADQYIISTNKFIILCIATFGLYELWWASKVWIFFKVKDKLKIMPVLRAFFNDFFYGALISRIRKYAIEKGYEKYYFVTVLFIGYLFFIILSFMHGIYALFSVFSFMVFIEPFNALNYAMRNSTKFIVIEQEKFNVREIVLLVIGSILWILLILGYILKLTEPNY